MRSLRGVGGPLVKFSIFAVVTILATLLLAGTIANQVGGDTSSYNAKFTDVTGLNPGDEIRIAGVRVGSVESIQLVDRKVALVKFSVRREIVLPQTVQATIRFRNLIGQRYIALDQGVGPPGTRLIPGATIPLTQTHPAVNLTQLFNGFQPLFRALSPQQVNQLSYELIKVLQGEGGTVNSLLAHTASLTSTIADKDQVIGEVIDNLNQVLDTVNSRDEQFTQLIITVRQLIAGLAADRDTIGDAVQSLGELTEATADLLRDARPPLRGDIEQLGKLAHNLNQNQDLVERFLVTLPRKLDVLTPLGTYGSWFNFYLCDLGVTLPDGTKIKVTEIPLQDGTVRPIGADRRCTAEGLPNNFGIHDDDQGGDYGGKDHGDQGSDPGHGDQPDGNRVSIPIPANPADRNSIPGLLGGH